MFKSLFTAMALAAITMSGAAQAQAANRPGTHLMSPAPYTSAPQLLPFKAAPSAVWHSNATCRNIPKTGN